MPACACSAIGYATPYLIDFQERAQRVLAFMPAGQGVVHWPQWRPLGLGAGRDRR